MRAVNQARIVVVAPRCGPLADPIGYRPMPWIPAADLTAAAGLGACGYRTAHLSDTYAPPPDPS